MIGIMGAGPRTGTGFVMRKAHEAGLPVYWDRNLNIPGSSYDTTHYPAGQYIAKVWPGQAAPMSRAIVLKRDRGDQLRSMREQAQREGYVGFTAEQMLDRSLYLLSGVKAPKLMFHVEHLDDEIDQILDILSFEVRKCH